MYVPSRRTVPPLLHVAGAALIAGPSSDVPPATLQVVARAVFTAQTRITARFMTGEENILNPVFSKCMSLTDLLAKAA